jgi:hypothetical protein
MKSRLFGERPVGVMSVVDAPLSRSFAHKARIAFYAVAFLGGGLAVAVLSTRMVLAAAVLLGALIGVAAGLVVGVVVRVWPVLRALWWWADAIGSTVLLLVAYRLLAAWLSPLWALLILGGISGGLAAFGPTRRFLTAWIWCGVIRHRLRMCFGQFIRAANRHGAVSLPLMLLARPTPAGARAWVWLRPGLDLTDLEGKTGKLAVACWAGEVRVVRASPRYAALLRLDLARKDPLTRLVTSPLAHLFGADWPTDAPVSPGMPPLGLDLDDVPEPPAEPRSSRR